MDFITEPEKQIPVICDVDVAVAGGGIAGTMAALAAARQNARTVVIDAGYRGYMVDCSGNEIWRKEKAGYGRTIKLAECEMEYIFTTPPGRPPMILDGLGNVAQELDMPASTYKEDRFDDGDTGVRALYAIADTRGNGRQDILAYNRNRLWHWAQE